MHPLPRLRCLSLLQLKTTTAAINHVKQIHAQLLINALNSPSIFATLIQRYCAISPPHATNYARLVFTHFHVPNLYLLNVLIRCSLPRHSILVFANWVSRATLIFDDFTYIFVLGACARCSTALWEGKQIHARILKHGFRSNIMIQTTAIHFYASNKDVLSARRVFDEMPERSSVTWNSMITGYCSQRERANEHDRNARRVFDEMPERSSVTWKSMITGYCSQRERANEHEHACNALMLFCGMLVDVCGVKPTDTTMVCVLSAASQLGVLESGTCVHGYIEKTIFVPLNDVYIGTGLVDMYSKCGCLDSASYIFMRMTKKNVLTWTAMMTGLAIHGKGKQALELLDAMEGCGIKPNAVTLTSLLSACCHAGLVEEGLYLFHSMESFGVAPLLQHYGCIVDLLGRAGHLKDAYEFITGMQVERDAVLWRSLLNACKVHGDVVMGEKVAKVLLRIQPDQNFECVTDMSEDYIALSNVYASAERWEDVEMVRMAMKVKGIETKPGCSSVNSVNNHLLD